MDENARNFTNFSATPSRTRTVSSVTPYLRDLRQLWEEGYYNKRQLWLKLQQQGYSGSYSSVSRALAKFPPADPTKVNNNNGESKPATNLTPLPKLDLRLRPLSPKGASWLLLHEDKKLTAQDLVARQVLLKLCPQAPSIYDLAQEFKQLMKEHDVKALDKWLMKASKSGIVAFERFAQSLNRDYAAVKAGIELAEYSNGQTEGHVNRLKWIKRAMFGRARFDLLSRKVLYNRAS